MSRRPHPVVLLLSLVVACGDNAGLVLPDAQPPDANDIGAVPRVEPAPCRFEVAASLGLTEGADYECGDLVVVENRDATARVDPRVDSRHIRLHFIRIAGAVGSSRATIYLDGGPGGDGQGILDHAAELGSSFLTGLLAGGDFLVLGQRGTRLSVPHLDCQEPACADFAEIADLPSYNTASNADDVNDLRIALGLDQLDLYGISYGSRLGLEVLRRHGDHVRAAVIEGLVPPQVIWPAAISSSFYGALTALRASCDEAPACGDAFGDIVAKFLAGIHALNANPVLIEAPGVQFDLDGYTYAYVVFNLMYARSSYPMLPLVINDLAIRRTDRVSDFIASLFRIERLDISLGLYYSVVCGELFNPPNPSAVDAANADVPSEIRDTFDWSFHDLIYTCEDWPKGDLQAALAQPVTSSVPTLVSSGRLDPITPPSFGDVAAATLTSSSHVLHEGSGHGAMLQSECGVQNLLAFLADPGGQHDTSCAATITNEFVVPGTFTGPSLSWPRIRAELALAPSPPFITERLRRSLRR